MEDYFVEEDPHKRDSIAAHQLSVFGQYQKPREKPVRLSEVKDMSEEMKKFI
jgi:hypothetical protein